MAYIWQACIAIAFFLVLFIGGALTLGVHNPEPAPNQAILYSYPGEGRKDWGDV